MVSLASSSEMENIEGKLVYHSFNFPITSVLLKERATIFVSYIWIRRPTNLVGKDFRFSQQIV